MNTDLIEQIDLRFQSGNSVPVQRAFITADEWEAIKNALRTVPKDNK